MFVVATARSQDGIVLPGAPVTFISRDPSVFEVGDNGRVTGHNSGVSRLVAVSGSVRDSIPVVVYHHFNERTLELVDLPDVWGVRVSTQGVMYVTQGLGLLRFDLPSLTATDTIRNTASPIDLVFTEDGQVAYTCGLGGGVSRVNVATGTVDTTYLLGEELYRILLSVDETRLYVSTPSGTVRVLSAATGANLDTIAATVWPANGMALSNDGSRLFVSGIGEEIAEINTVAGTVVRKLPIEGQLQDIALAPNGSELYVADEMGWMKVVNVSSGLVTDSVSLPGAFGLTVSPDGRYIVVTQVGPKRIVVLERASRAFIRVFDVGEFPRRAAFDATGATLAVTIRDDVGNGALAVIR